MDAGLMFLAVLHIATRELLEIAAFGIALSSLDDFAIDMLFFTRHIWRRGRIYRRHKRMFVEDLPPRTTGAMAIIVPAWDEADVIGAMLRDLTTRIDYPAYRVFVGVYPNDVASQAAVAAVGDARVQMVVCTRPGPTTKADCLNHLWRAICAHEDMTGVPFKGVVLHDAEDVCHAHELTVYNYLLGHLAGRLAMVQLPVVPLVDAGSRWISGHYLDEFAELHAKDVVVREAIGAAVPSAGVACAIDRAMLGRIAEPGGPFDATCLTEDYELGLKIKALGGRGALVRIRSRSDGRLVATREHFPSTFDTALRQKTRWLLGIALSGWDRIGWQGGIADRYMLLRDRKAVLASLLTLFGYLAVLLVAINEGVAQIFPMARAMPALVAPGSLLACLLVANAAMLGQRLAMRALFSTRAYGWREGVRAVPRAIVGNAINAVAALRACRRYWRIARGREASRWDKTAHRFPTVPT
jgi:bacteriophage N4 adsorption protein B